MVAEKEIPNFKSCSRQAIFICVGQAGCQIGSTIWALLNEEHCILPDGNGLQFNSAPCPHLNFYKDSLYYKDDEFHRMFSYFQTKDTDKFVPRNLFVDLESTVIDEIKTGVYRNLFSEDLNYYQFTKMGDGSSLFPRAYNNIGRYIVDDVMNSIRHLAEKTDQLRVFNIARSYGGGTGSGLGSLILETLAENYSKVILSETNVFNARMRDSPTLEPFNTLFGIESSCSCSGITVLYNNKALQNICFNRLGIKRPLLISNNQLIAYSVSGIYSTERFPGYGNCNIDSLLTNLIPYPRIQFPVCTLAPITKREVIKYEKYSTPSDLIGKIISSDYVMFDTNLNSGSYISCCMIYRGMVSPGNIAQSHQDLILSKKIQFIEWNPNSIKNGHSPLGLVDLPNFDFGVSQLSMVMLANHTNINASFEEQTLSVHIMLKKKAFLHWFYECGVEEDDFKSALENLILLNLDYKEIEKVPIQENKKLSDDSYKRKTKESKPKSPDSMFRRPNRKRVKSIKADNSEMLHNRPILNEDKDDKEKDDNLPLAIKIESDETPMSMDYNFQCETRTESGDKTNLDSFLNQSRAKLSLIDNDKNGSLHRPLSSSIESIDEVQKKSIKTDDIQPLPTMVLHNTFEESFVNNIVPRQSLNLSLTLKKEKMTLEKSQDLVERKMFKRKRKAKSAITSGGLEKAKRDQILFHPNQTRCSLSLFKTFEESFILNISPKTSLENTFHSLRTSMNVIITQPVVLTC